MTEIKLINSKDANNEAGAFIKDGVITPFQNIELDPFLEQVKQFREEYRSGDAPKHMHHIARLEASVIENIRLTNKWPNDAEGRKLALKEAVRMVKSGELAAFAIHDY